MWFDRLRNQTRPGYGYRFVLPSPGKSSTRVAANGLCEGASRRYFLPASSFPGLNPRVSLPILSSHACRPRLCNCKSCFNPLPCCARVSFCAVTTRPVVKLDTISRSQVITPKETTVCHGGQLCSVQWLDDGVQPLLATMGPCYVSLYAGDEARSYV